MNRLKNVFILLVSSLLLSACGGGAGTEDVVDGAPGIVVDIVGGNSVVEGASGAALRFTMTLSATNNDDVELAYETRSSSAVAGEDFVGDSGTVTIPAGALSADIDITVLDDALDEPDESFQVALLSTTAGTIGIATASGNIEDDDPPPAISIADASIAEGNTGQADLEFLVTLSAASGFDISVDYATADETATEGSDYTATSGTANITAGNTSTTLTVPVIGDSELEDDEQFRVNLSNPVNATLQNTSASGTIRNDDGPTNSGLDSRPQNLSCVAPAQPDLNASITTEAAFPSLPGFVKPVGLLQAPGDTGQWFVVEQDGRVLRFSNTPGVSSTSTFIDIRNPGGPVDVDSGSSEAGLLGMAFDPNYGNGNWDVYLSYTIDEVVSGRPFRSIIARFVSTDNGLTLDPNSAEVLLTLDQPESNHNGGHIVFGPDNYLYIGFGDGGSGNDPNDNAQNTSNLFGTVLRIDVHSSSPYSIPNDNPFFGNALCKDGDGSAACPEIYAWGLRNPWRWSFDGPTGQLWLGDVGQNSWEEVNLIANGGNYGWRCREGAHSNITSGNCPPGLIDPVIEYSNVNVGDSITGGYVYRGAAIPELIGRYVFADYVRGKIFASVDNGNGSFGFETLVDTNDLISNFTPEANGELLYLAYGFGDGEIRRIIPSGGSTSNPIADKLSDTGCVDPSNPSQAAGGLIPYDVSAPFWSDGAAKERYYAIPDGQSIGVAADGDWQFPVGSVLMKHFRLGNKLVETRLFMRHTNGEWAGYTYEWNSGETEATRVVGGMTRNINGQDYIYPSESDCMRCHTSAAGFSLGPEHGQLNNDILYPATGRTANQLVTADFVDLLTDPLSDTPANLPNFPDPGDTSAPLDERARSYLHTNCAGCHRPGGPTPSNMDLRYATPLGSTNPCNADPASGDLGIANAKLIAPGAPDRSLVIERASRRDAHGMPPLGSNQVDTLGVTLLTNWVNALGSCS